MRNTSKIIATLVASAFLIAPSFAQSNDEDKPRFKPASEINGTKLGVLDCTIEGGFGLLVGSKKAASCTFEHTDGTVENYVGSLNKLGLDIGISGESFLSWIVFTPIGNKVGDFALAGDYVGVSANASLGIGLGANALVGGSNKKIGLQPFSIEGKTGLNLAIGFSKLSLEAVQ